jgi:hypothetical protein
MAEEWRVEVDLEDQQHGLTLSERLRSLDLDDEARERLGDRVVVSRDGPRMFLYAASGEQAREAERVARDLAARVGLELAGATVRVTDGYAARTVTIAPAVGGQPTSGFSWTVTVGAKGVVQYASGFLATPEPADTYPLIGVAEGFERLRKSPRPSPLVPMARPVAPAVERVPCPPAAKLPCATRPLPARVATVTGVRLGLQRAPAVANGNRPGLAYLLPAYLFDLEGGWTEVRAIIAVPDRYLTRP